MVWPRPPIGPRLALSRFITFTIQRLLSPELGTYVLRVDFDHRFHHRQVVTEELELEVRDARRDVPRNPFPHGGDAADQAPCVTPSDIAPLMPETHLGDSHRLAVRHGDRGEHLGGT